MTLSITGVTQDEPTGTTPDAVLGPGSNSVRLRAERDGSGDGRVYRVSFEASDGRGGTCTGFATVGVRKGSGPAVDSAPPSYDSFGDLARHTRSPEHVVDVRLFAMLRERAGTESVTVEVREGATVREAVDAVAHAHDLGDLVARMPVVMAVNREYA